MFKKMNKKVVFGIACLIVLIAVTSIVTWAIRSTPTEPVAYVTIQSDDYGSEGSWKIKKSSRWIDKNKANITFELETLPKTNNHKKDVVFVIDNSESMNGGNRINSVKTNLKNIINYILNDSDNRVALITFNSSSEVLSNFTNDINSLTSIVDDINATGETNYNAALLNVDSVLNNYEASNNRDLNVVFFTDGKPTVDNPDQIVTFELLKDKYSFLKINGVQYKVSSSIMDELVQITDDQFSADEMGLYTAFLRASVDPYSYDSFAVEDYIESDFFELLDINKIYTSVGSTNISEENGKTKITWNLGNDFLTGKNAKLIFYVKLKDDYKNVPNLYATNNYEKISYKFQNGSLNVKESDLTPVLKNFYTVTYDNNLPNGCSISSFPSENYTPYSNVTIKQDRLSCSGYNFNGWEIDDSSTQRIGDDHFLMPEKNIVLRAIWSKPNISKSMNGTIHEKTTLYKKMEGNALNNLGAAMYTGQSNDGGGNEKIYYSNSSSNNYVRFAGYCWGMIRTTDTGGVKLQLLSGLNENGSCSSTTTYIGVNGSLDIIDLGTTQYAYGTSFEYDESNKLFSLSGNVNNYSWRTQHEDIIGKYTCEQNDSNAKCSNLTYIEGYLNSDKAYRKYLTHVQHGIGSSYYNSDIKSLSSVGYMYNEKYDYDTKNMGSNSADVLYSNSFAQNFYVATSYNYTNSSYELDNPYLIAEQDFNNEDLSSLVGKYTLRSDTSNSQSSSIYYIVATEGTNIYYLQISGGNNLANTAIDIYFGDEIQDNGNNTYSLSGNISSINKLDWYSNYANSRNLYTCFSSSQTCGSPYYVVDSSNKTFEYEDGTKNYVYGNSFQYDSVNNEYILQNTTTFNGFTKNYGNIATHHYTCFNTSGRCQTLAYIFYVKDNSTPMFIYLNNNESVDDAINNMINSNDINTYDSRIKSIIEWWFENQFAQYESYLEDVTFCNDRTISNLGGWNPQAGVVSYNDSNVSLNFTGSSFINNASVANTSLLCSNKLDRFTKSNEIGNKKLKYPVGLLSLQEAYLTLNLQANLNQAYMTPMIFNGDGAHVSNLISGNKTLSYYSVNLDKYIMPVISLKAGTEYISGNGSSGSPYYVPTDFD